MGKIILSIVSVLLLGISPLMAQDDQTTDKARRKAEKERLKAERKAETEARNSLLFERAEQALRDGQFVLEAERIEFKRGNYVYVTSYTNFVSLENGRAIVQLAFNIPSPGFNGMGGITVDGQASSITMKTDKNGNILYEMHVQGVAISARVYFRLVKGTNKCVATISPNFNSDRISFVGYLYPASDSFVIRGWTI